MLNRATPITEQALQRYRAAYESSDLRKAMTRIFSKSGIGEFGFSTMDGRPMQFFFNHDIKTMSSTNQKGSGRCWLFAATNLLREIIAKDKNLDSFELSQSYLAFWDKYERVNYYIDSVIDTAHLPCSDRLVDTIVGTGVHDGGQWDMFVNIVNKYGIVPQSAYPETAQSSSTGKMNGYLNRYLRKMTPILRDLAAAGKEKELAEVKDEMLSRVWGFLVSCYGVPPTTFDWEYCDKDKKVVLEKGYTPLSYAKAMIGDRLADYVSIIHAPTADKPYGELYTVEYLGNVVGGEPIRYVNLPLDEMKRLVVEQIKDGEPVWFGSDCGKYQDGAKRAWDPAPFEEELFTGLSFEMSKEDMLNYHVSQMNHAMVFTGVHLDEEEKPVRFKIENSWGADGVNGGYYMCSDAWFDAYVYQAVIHKKYLGEYLAILDKEPIVLKLWDPMGSLAD